jgi:hypothetical protein
LSTVINYNVNGEHERRLAMFTFSTTADFQCGFIG